MNAEIHECIYDITLFLSGVICVTSFYAYGGYYAQHEIPPELQWAVIALIISYMLALIAAFTGIIATKKEDL